MDGNLKFKVQSSKSKEGRSKMEVRIWRFEKLEGG